MGAFCAVRIIWCGSLFAMGDFCHFADKFIFLIEDIEKSTKMLFVA